MKNETQKFHVGDEVEVTNKKLKTFGIKGVIKEMGYSPFHINKDDWSVRNHNFDVTGHDCIVALESGSTIRFKDENIKVTKAAIIQSKIVLNTFTEIKTRNGFRTSVFVPENDFNKNVEGNYYMVMELDRAPEASYSIINPTFATTNEIKDTKAIARLKSLLNIIQKSTSLYSVVIENRKISSFTDSPNMGRDAYFHERSFYDRRSLDPMFDVSKRGSFKELRTHYDTSFTVRGDHLDGLIRELILEQGVSQESIKVYKLQSPQKVDVKVDINVG